MWLFNDNKNKERPRYVEAHLIWPLCILEAWSRGPSSKRPLMYLLTTSRHIPPYPSGSSCISRSVPPKLTYLDRISSPYRC